MKCECEFRTRLVGDGCQICNPEKALEVANDRIADLEEALRKIANLADAYPIEVFPEPDWKKSNEVLNAAGLSLSRISAANMRHVVTRVADIAKSVL